ncbi:unnamed protein product [Brassica oleracea var. botrytis]|uniref:Uncharacterized protein n=1 Tax=Brassica oleracea TaxID=3712 RepID=A0A3P6DH86_BRAOL|nr:unnamed protein product [Brassica oleracea]
MVEKESFSLEKKELSSGEPLVPLRSLWVRICINGRKGRFVRLQERVIVRAQPSREWIRFFTVAYQAL